MASKQTLTSDWHLGTFVVDLSKYNPEYWNEILVYRSSDKAQLLLLVKIHEMTMNAREIAEEIRTYLNTFNTLEQIQQVSWISSSISVSSVGEIVLKANEQRQVTNG